MREDYFIATHVYTDKGALCGLQVDSHDPSSRCQGVSIVLCHNHIRQHRNMKISGLLEQGILHGKSAVYGVDPD